jgi:hypothetical protein
MLPFPKPGLGQGPAYKDALASACMQSRWEGLQLNPMGTPKSHNVERGSWGRLEALKFSWHPS